jgi:hypothetical protein
MPVGLLAESKGVRHIVGLQRRLGPSALLPARPGEARVCRQDPLCSQDRQRRCLPRNYSGKVRVGLSRFQLLEGPVRPLCPLGDLLFRAGSFPKKLTAVVENQFAFLIVAETGEKISNTPSAAMVIGTLEGGGLFSIQIEGGQQHRTGLQIDITGTEEVLRVTNLRAFENKKESTSPGWITNSPSGFRQSKATFARNSLGATPAEAVKLNSARICSRIVRCHFV